MSYRLFLIPGVVLSVLYGFLMASIAGAEPSAVTVTSGQPTFELVGSGLQRDVHADYGVGLIQLPLDSPIGPTAVFDRNYAWVPEVSISLSG